MHELQSCRTIEGICACVLNFARQFGGTNLLAGIIPPPRATRRQQLSHVVLDRWPVEWSHRYFSSGYLYHDPAIRLVTGGTDSFLWSEICGQCNVSNVGHRVMHEAAEFRLREGVTITFMSVERRAIGFSIAGDRFELDPCQRKTMQLVAAYAVGRAIEIEKGFAVRPAAALSTRQYEVLRWAADGLNLSQIADRLGISENTADTHLRAVRQRLGVTTTIHAVAEAFRMGLIT